VKLYDKSGDGMIGEAEFPSELRFAMRPELEKTPHSQNYATFNSLDRNKDGLLQESEWEAFRTRIAATTKNHGLLAIRLVGDTPEVIWRENTAIPEVPSPLLYRGRLFLVRNGGVVTCLNAKTGKVIYRARVGAPGPYFSPPVAAAGRVYLASSEGVVSVLAADSDQLEVLARNDLGEDIIATPSIMRNAIYIRTFRHLYMFGER
jgi:outer membrane protein assembly factor BamB